MAYPRKADARLIQNNNFYGVEISKAKWGYSYGPKNDVHMIFL